MLRLSDLTPEQIEKMKKFYRKYDETTLKFYKEIFAKQKREIVNQPYYESYQNIINSTARLIREMGSKDPITASVIFEYLLWNGYFSQDKQLVYCVSGRINNMTITGADIMRGKSVCLNNADMLTRVLQSMGMEAYIMGCGTFPKKDTKREFKVNIERNMIKEKEGLLKRLIGFPLTRIIGNHAVTLVKSGETYYVSDPTSLAFASITDFLKARYIGINLDMKLKPWLLLAVGEGDKKENLDSMVKAFLLSDRKPIPSTNIKELYDNLIPLLDESKPLLNDFHAENRRDIDTVSKTLTKVKI